MKTKRSILSFLIRSGGNAKAAAVRAASVGRKTTLTPEQRRIADESLRRFGALYRKLAE